MEHEMSRRFNTVEREDVHYEVCTYAGKYVAYVEYDGFIGADGFTYHADSFRVGNRDGYKTERGAINACMRHNDRLTLFEA